MFINEGVRITHLLVVVAIATVGLEAQAQRKSGGTGGTATFAVLVTDPAGTPLGGVRVTVQGPAERSATTERGLIAFENLPSGTYRLRFERRDFVTLEREVMGRGGAPIDVKVTLTPAPPPPEPPPPPVPTLPPTSSVKVDPVTIDISTFIEKNFVGRAAGKTSPLACSGGGAASLIQVRDPLAEHTHAEADEYLYVVAGAGSARIGGRETPLQTGVFVLIPRGVAHGFTEQGRTPLVLLSVKAGDRCAAAATR